MALSGPLFDWTKRGSAGCEQHHEERDTMSSTQAAAAIQEPDPRAPELASVLDVSDRFDAIHVHEAQRRFGRQTALDGVSLRVRSGQIHALLGPNGAGKTTLLRILSGLLSVDSGSVFLMGADVTARPTALRGRIGLVPSGDRSFYLRLSGVENLAFFGRLHGLRRKEAFRRARQGMEDVGLADAGRKRVGLYSHGMQKRLSVARALLSDPTVLLVDEATHDLDPEGAVRIRELIRRVADSGAAVVWATQRLDEIRAFADQVTLIDRGQRRFVGTVANLMDLAVPTSFLVRLESRGPSLVRDAAGTSSLAGVATLSTIGDPNDDLYRISLADGSAIGDALAALHGAGIRVLTCRHERSEVEEAFLALTGEQAE
jgi:ABC-2 type transport system ATP-binding protein